MENQLNCGEKGNIILSTRQKKMVDISRIQTAGNLHRYVSATAPQSTTEFFLILKIEKSSKIEKQKWFYPWFHTRRC